MRRIAREANGFAKKDFQVIDSARREQEAGIGRGTASVTMSSD
jgi:hypothetical protein